MNGMTRRERQVTDIDEIIKILDKSKVLHLGLVDGDEPYVVPMNYGYIMEDGKLTIYLHGANRGRKLDLIRANPKVFFEMCCDIVPFEGEVACKYGITYASVMGRGIAEIVEDVEGTVGSDALNSFGEYEEDSVFVLNEQYGAAYEILLDESCYGAPNPTEDE